VGWTFDDLRNAPGRKPSAKRAKQDRENVRGAWSAHWRKGVKVTTEDELEADGVDFGIEMDER
jgi:hypothetical protein